MLLTWLGGAGLLADLSASVHRIVHGGERFRATARLGDAELSALAALDELAPLHNPPALAVIASVRARLPASVPLIGVFDTAYYATLPEVAWRYAIPERWYRDFGVRRYGFHGIAHRYLCSSARARVAAGKPSSRVVSLQLGRGCSVTATLAERPIATSMGFTPVEGLVMGTRSGDFDPGALLHVMEHGGLSPAAMRGALDNDSGLKGLSGGCADMQELLRRERQGDAPAKLAVEIFCRRARQYLGAFVCELGGVRDRLRRRHRRTCARDPATHLGALEWAGITIDPLANEAADAGSIAAAHSRAAIEVIRLDEASVLAAEAAALLERTA